ncbi:hypothetical protein HOY34_11375 [Xinfangfangia sp. D13-10-4-6]|uniref:hypothetical protein n=1 Tax=Pseudogemmobacter hezensis TaxID=2737662 RepID=UPI0015528B8D|nr:hypothetical protein [Pseudogemmobacter hezensis]NPD15802.1 hypothetical protein [Pseudogemmobacter hezensis]
MALAKHNLTPALFQELRLSDMFSDPRLSRAFRRGEDGEPLAIPMPVRPIEPEFGALFEELVA